MAVWHVYMIRCGNGNLYTGITTDVERRFSEHQAAGSRAARYLKGRGPLSLVLAAETRDRATALRVERRIKGFSRARKERLIQDPSSLRKIIDTSA